MKKEKITAVIVVYNKDINESITFQNILNMDISIDILVIDNSDKENNNGLICEQNSIKYIPMNGNKGLSKAYNVAIDNLGYSDVVILFDDDTDVNYEYFNKLEKSLKLEEDIDIFAPIIRGQDGVIYSPNEFNFLKNKLIYSDKKNVSQEKFNAISSCLAIRMRVFNNYRFNEKLFVDQVDQFFFCEQRKRGKKFGIIEVVINQNFYQRGKELTPEAGWKRLRIRIIDIFRHARLMEMKKYIFLAFLKSCGLGVQIGKKSKSIGVVFKAGFLSTKLIFKDM